MSNSDDNHYTDLSKAKNDLRYCEEEVKTCKCFYNFSYSTRNIEIITFRCFFCIFSE